MNLSIIKPRDGVILDGFLELYELPKDFTYEKYTLLANKKDYLFTSGKNKIVDVGINQIIALLTGTSTNSFTHCSVGSGTNTVSAGDTELQTVIGSRHAITQRYRSGLSAKFDTFYGVSENNGTWNESGLFTAVSGGTMLARKLLSALFTKSSSNTALLAWTVTLAAV